ncbi:MAG: HAMP domain-containing histidine kinase [Clostridia bacterium]|nr:HAMP domain-containing histidine kinase [Clostridia bacterium]
MKELIAMIILAVIFALSTFLLLFKLLLVKKGVKEINAQLPILIEGNTNALINLSTYDSQLRELANTLNSSLKNLREKELTYINGDKELKSAITNVAHDIRTPLTAICGYVDMLKDESDHSKIDKYLAIISQRATALKTLSEELFKYSVATNTNPEKTSEPEKIDVNSLLQDTLFSFYDKFCERGIVPKISSCKSAIHRITDKNSLIRIFSNIIENAIKYSDGDFSVNIQEDGMIRFSNTAHNLNNVDVAKLFDRFFTVENGKYSTGLGLSIAKQLTKQLGGDISAEYNNNALTIVLKI